MRSPFGPATATDAPSAMSAGTVSALATARHRALDGATRHTTSACVFMQKPSAVRQNRDWSYQLQRVSRQTFPPIVPMFRSCGVETSPAASASAVYSLRILGCTLTLVRLAPA